jgi:Uma2 family endonuclease
MNFIPKYTYKDYQGWEGKWEIIYGVPFAMTTWHSLKHQDICFNICSQLKQLVKYKDECKVYISPEWKIFGDTVVQPDVSLINHNETSENNLTIPPVIIFEVVSPATSARDRETKFKLYEEQGVNYYIIVDPKNEIVEIFEHNNMSYSEELTGVDNDFTFKIPAGKITFDFNKIW